MLTKVTIHTWLDASIIDAGPKATADDMKRIQEAFGILQDDLDKPLVMRGIEIEVMVHNGSLFGSRAIESKILDTFLE